MPRNLCKSNGVVAGTAKCHEITMEWKPQKKDEERQEEEEATEKLKKQKMARGFSLFEEALLVLEAQDLNGEWYMQVSAAVQNAT